MRIHLATEAILSGNRTSLAKAITLVESTSPKHNKQAQKLISEIIAQKPNLAKKTFRIGISGPPGAGKSTFIESLGMYLISQGHRVAVLAIDPSSPRTGGSLLGDKTRMSLLSSENNGFVRPTPARGTLGGIAQSTSDSILLCEGANYDIILVETVGIGQSEFMVSNIVDMLLLLLTPTSGDELQGLKKGILEMADIIAINKADGEYLKSAQHTKVAYSRALQLVRHRRKL